jgi:tetratricopeptide (TPR) repeat protein
MMKYGVSILILSALAAAAPAPEPLLDRGYSQMYNLQFPEAHNTFREWQRLHPDDPMGPASEAAAYLFSEFDRLHILESEFFTQDQHFITDNKLAPDPALKQNFQKALKTSRDLAARAPNDKNAQFAAILCSGLESDYSALIEKRYRVSFQQMKAGRAMAERLLAQDPTFYDAWLAVGVENYMLSVKPAPVRFLLRLGGGETDRDVGIEKLRLTAEKGRYLAPFAKLLLAVAALRDKDTARAKELLAGLTRDYPHNPLYRQELARIAPVASRDVPQ